MFSNDNNVETIAQLVEVLKHYIGLQSEYVRLDVINYPHRVCNSQSCPFLSVVYRENSSHRNPLDDII